MVSAIFVQAENNTSEEVVQSKLNFVLFLADDCTNWDIGCCGSVDSKTPNIDKLAEEGMKFEKCYQAAPMCSPTRHNLYTGLYPVKSGAYPNHTKAYPGTESIVHYLKPRGYRVALSGKRHIGPESVFPFEYLGEDKNPDFGQVEKFLKDVKEKRQPFALILCSNEPHYPWDKGVPKLFDPQKVTLPPNFVDTKETREAFVRYLAEINYLDKQVGNALELLQENGFTENTLFVFASEQGSCFPFSKWTLYEAGVKSALIARKPGLTEPGTTTEALVEYSDILPTFIELAGGKIPEKLDGKSLVPVITGKNNSGKDYSFSIQTTRGIAKGSDYYGIRAVVNDRYRYIWNLTPEAEFKNNINNGGKAAGDWYPSWVKEAKTDPFARELISNYRKRPAEELYDINEDKWCMKNLANDPQYEKIKKQLREELVKWMKECGDEGQQTELDARKH